MGAPTHRDPCDFPFWGYSFLLIMLVPGIVALVAASIIINVAYQHWICISPMWPVR